MMAMKSQLWLVGVLQQKKETMVKTLFCFILLALLIVDVSLQNTGVTVKDSHIDL